ncbi:MAG: TldD/PmbA family protein [Candidatus Asgardarchaeia archaeon]
MSSYTHLLEKMSTKNKVHITLIKFKEKSYSLALRPESIEENFDERASTVIRVFSKHGWGITTVKTDNSEEISRAINRAIKLSNITRPLKTYHGPVELAECEISSGTYIHKEKIPFENADIGDVSSIINSIRDMALSKLRNRFAWTEVILTYKKQIKQILTSDGINITEVKPTTDFVFYLTVKGPGGRLSTSSGILGFTAGFETIYSKNLDNLIDNIVFRAYRLSQAGRVNPMLKGRQLKAVVNYEVAGALIHEAVGHALEGDKLIETGGLGVSLKGTKVASDEINVVDDPTIPTGYGSYFFDDEGVKARKKVLIREGQIAGFLHTRLSASYFKDLPNGSARGIFHQPRALMSNLYIVPGDWKFEEMIQDLRDGLYLEGLIGATMQNNIVTLEPEIAFIVEKGELKKPIYNLKLAVRADKILSGIDAIGKDFRLRTGLEKGHPISDGGAFLRIQGIHIV